MRTIALAVVQNADDYVGTDFVAHAGYNQWADTNNLIVLYPQTVSSSGVPFNPNGCWDWWGYNESGYATKSGSQIAAVRAMLTQVAKGYTGWSPAPTALSALRLAWRRPTRPTAASRWPGPEWVERPVTTST